MVLQLILYFLLGLVIGSFLNVVIYRIPRNESFLGGRSFCDNCRKNILWFDLIPLLSYLILKGRCRFCKAKINPQIVLVELITLLLFTSAFLKFPVVTDPSLIFNLFFISVLISVFFIDLNEGIIPDKIILPAFVLVGIFVLINQNLLNHILSAFFASLFFFIFYFLSKGKAMGFGDVKFAGLIGLFFGFPGVVLSLYLAFLTGGIVSLILILWRKKRWRGDTIALGPFLSLGGIITIFLGDLLVSRLLSFLL